MKRWTYRLLPLLILLVVGAIFLGAFAPDTVTHLKFPAFEQRVPATLDGAGPRIVYKWQDAQGGWHYEEAPPKDQSWQTIRLDPDTNLIPAIQPASPDNAPLLTGEGKRDPLKTQTSDPGAVFSKLLDARQEAQAAKEQLEQRLSEQQKQLSEIR